MLKKEQVAEIVAKFGTHEGDTGSSRVQVALLTEQIKALTNAHAPGIGTILILFSIASFTISSPGSEIPGVPASVIKAIFLLSNNFSINNSDLTSSLCLW